MRYDLTTPDFLCRGYRHCATAIRHAHCLYRYDLQMGSDQLIPFWVSLSHGFFLK